METVVVDQSGSLMSEEELAKPSKVLATPAVRRLAMENQVRGLSWKYFS